MKKTLYLLGITLAALIFSACSQKEEGKKTSNPVSDPGGYAQDMAGLKNDMQKNIQDATNKENEKLNNTLKENNMNTQTQSGFGDNSALAAKYQAAIIKTNLGDIKVKFDGANAPVTVGNFLRLATDGFYDGVKFHRVIKGFMIQAGDPLSKDDTQKDRWGTGGPGYSFADELKGTEKYPQGTLAMANAGPNTNGSQFFIVTASPAAPLPASYTIFGNVVSGLDTALKIENVKTGTSDRPVEDVVIESLEALEK